MCTKAPQSNGDIYWIEPGFSVSDKDHTWKEKEDKAKGKKYYTNLGSGEKLWKLPAGATGSGDSGKDKNEKKTKKEKEGKDKKEKKSKKEKGGTTKGSDDDDAGAPAAKSNKTSAAPSSKAVSDNDDVAAGLEYDPSAPAASGSILKPQRNVNGIGSSPAAADTSFWTNDPNQKTDLSGVNIEKYMIMNDNNQDDVLNRGNSGSPGYYNQQAPLDDDDDSLKYQPRHTDPMMEDLRKLAEAPHKNDFVPGKPDGVDRHSTSPFGVDDPDFLPDDDDHSKAMRNTSKSPKEGLVHSQQRNADRSGGGMMNFEEFSPAPTSSSLSSRLAVPTPSAAGTRPPRRHSTVTNTSSAAAAALPDIDAFLANTGFPVDQNQQQNSRGAQQYFGRPGPPPGEKVLMDDHFDEDFGNFLQAERKSREASLAANSPNRVRHPADERGMELIDSLFKPPQALTENDMAQIRVHELSPRIHPHAIQSLTDENFMKSLREDLEQVLSENEVRYMRHLVRCSEEYSQRANELKDKIKFLDNELGIASTARWNDACIRGAANGVVDDHVMSSIHDRDFAERLDRLQHQIRTSHRENIATAGTVWEFFLSCLDAEEVDVAWIESIRDF